MKKLEYDDIIDRIIYFRNKSNLSVREASLRLGYNHQYFKQIESKMIDLKLSTLIKICELFEISLYDFFNLGTKYNSKSKEALESFINLSPENQQHILEIMKNLK